MSMPHLSSLFGRSSSQTLFSGPITPGGLSPETALELAREAFNSSEEHGAVARLARKYNVTRHVVEQCREAREEHLGRLFQPRSGIPVVSVTLDRRAIDRAIVATRAEIPVSIRNLRRIGALFLGFVMGYGTIWDTLDHAQRAAKAYLARIPLSRVKTVALDELFFRGRCVLVVIDIRTQTLCGIEVADDRTEATWTKLLTRLREEQALDPNLVVSDAGASILASARKVWPCAEQQRDIFHIKRELGQLLERLEKRAYGALAHYYKVEEEWLKASMSVRSLGQKVRYAREEADRRIGIYDYVFALVKRVFGALEFVDPCAGAYQDSARAEAIIAEVGQDLRIQRDKKIRKVGTFLLRHKGALSVYHSRLSETLMSLAHAGDEQKLVLTIACMHSLDGRIRSFMYRREQKELWAQRNRLADELLNLSIKPLRFTELISKTVQAIRTSGRASSLVECFNSVIRKFLRIHKHVSIGPLYLVAARWNLKRREDGPLAGSSPYTSLTGIEVKDWLTELGMEANPLPGPQAGTLPLNKKTQASQGVASSTPPLRLAA